MSERTLQERLRASVVPGHHVVPNGVMLEAAYAIESLEARVHELVRERDELRYWNGAVAVCKEHVDFIVSIDPADCVICELDERDARIEELEAEYRDYQILLRAVNEPSAE